METGKHTFFEVFCFDKTEREGEEQEESTGKWEGNISIFDINQRKHQESRQVSADASAPTDRRHESEAGDGGRR